MREIKFRGFYKDSNGTTTIIVNGEEYTGEWVFGFLNELKNRSEFYIMENALSFPISVIPETIGMVSQRFDKDHIFLIIEHDIVEDEILGQFVVEYYQDAFKLRYYRNGELGDYFCNLGEYLGKLEIVGTIFNKE